MTSRVEKILSPNDTGETGGHQAGILVPKTRDILAFFPRLDSTRKNPRVPLEVVDDAGQYWTFSFIHYNNKFFGGTRNEFRLTGMTAYIREFNLKAGDTIVLSHAASRETQIQIRRRNPKTNVIKLSYSWKVIDAEF